MDEVGLFCLGVFVGSIAAVGLKFMSDTSTWKQGMTAIILATLSGTSILFLDRFRESTALGTYPMGLMVALIWAYSSVAIAKIQAKERTTRILGWLHLGGAVLATLLVAALILTFAWVVAKAALAESH